MRTPAVIHAVVGCIVLSSPAVVAQDGPRAGAPWIASAVPPLVRALTLDDLLRIEELGNAFLGGEPIAFSPDGTRLAFVRLRPTAEAAFHDQAWLFGNARADIWMVSTEGGEPTRITAGASDGFGYWAPVWSPDGERLALLSNRDDNIRLHIWDRRTASLATPADRGTQPVLWAAPTWLSSSELLFTVLPEDEQAVSLRYTRASPRVATRAWAGIRDGREVTSSVLESGVAIDHEGRPRGQLLLHDVEAGETRVIYDGSVRELAVAPGAELIAGIVVRETFQPRAGQPLPHVEHADDYGLRLFNRQGALPAGDLAEVGRVIVGSLDWSRDGASLAFAGAVHGSDERSDSTVHVMVYTAATGAIDRPVPGNLEPVMAVSPFGVTPPRTRWSADGRLLVYARPTSGERADWWIIEAGGQPRNLTATLPTAPSQIHRVAGAAAWVGVSQGDVWLVPEQGSEPTRLGQELSGSITGLAWVDQNAARRHGVEDVVVRTRAAPGENSLYRLDLAEHGRVEPLTRPSGTAEMIAYSAEGGSAVFSAHDRNGTSLWLANPGHAAPRTLFEANRFLREVAEAPAESFEYQSLEGDTLVAWILLPPDGAARRADGAPYPLVTWVYPGVVSRDRPPSGTALNRSIVLSPQLLAAQGYAVLFPSMPQGSRSQQDDPLLHLTTGVLPAVDKAIELGHADPERLAVMGHSFGGYGTYGLITQTDRFHAAIALAGLSNLVSSYGVFDARLRYDERPHEQLFLTWVSESSQPGFGVPPWEDMDRYMRNSPITHVDRVETPLLIVHGDFDYVPIQAAEEFFTSLYRLGKRARFVRYWGEDHVLMSPANSRDMWRHIVRWLDEQLVAPENR